ncbi:peptidylprolyl isomerase [Coxiella endosymbiont of Amblyomma nuttalli]|uniref:peptidylprolyl isomerase n=1 Tax=Coxiella endosymbiont of Amblyomma nuttalli TaxID=2749996 RepID=UPI001BADF626|nr:peptidylprolyl isomerase [Coxiella endosymbiont of Amblyomma nuttalli]QTS83664.1 Peptidyl-prolyl cis-trans isomerase D [Coxiella endosymbiont of Amblyomma nuttalli]
MLQNFYKHVKGWVAWVIFAAMSFSFILWSMQYYLQSETGNREIVAKVDGKKITAKELATVFQQMKRTYVLKLGRQLVSRQSEALKQYTLQNLIMNNVLLHSAKKAGFRMSFNQISQFIAELPVFQRNGQFSKERYQAFLRENSLTGNEFFMKIGDALIIQQFADGIRSSAFVLPAEIKTHYELLRQTRNFRYVIIPSARFLNKVKIHKKMIADYYQKHCQVFRMPEKISIAYLLLSPSIIRQQILVSNREIKQYYKNIKNKNIKKIQSLSKLQARIKCDLIQEKVNEILTKKGNQLSTITYTDPTTLQSAARKLNLKIRTTGLFTRNGARKGIASNPKIIAMAFSNDILLQHNNSNLIKLKDGSLAVLRIKQYQPSYISPLNTVTLYIEQKIRKQLAEVQSNQLARKIQDAINQRQSLTMIKNTDQLVWKIEKNVERINKTIPMPIIKGAFSIPLTKEHSVITTILSNGDSALIQVIAIKLAKFNAVSQKQLDTLMKILLVYYGNLDYQFYIQDALKHAKIKVL